MDWNANIMRLKPTVRFPPCMPPSGGAPVLQHEAEHPPDGARPSDRKVRELNCLHRLNARAEFAVARAMGVKADSNRAHVVPRARARSAVTNANAETRRPKPENTSQRKYDRRWRNASAKTSPETDHSSQPVNAEDRYSTHASATAETNATETCSSETSSDKRSTETCSAETTATETNSTESSSETSSAETCSTETASATCTSETQSTKTQRCSAKTAIKRNNGAHNASAANATARRGNRHRGHERSVSSCGHWLGDATPRPLGACLAFAFDTERVELANRRVDGEVVELRRVEAERDACTCGASPPTCDFRGRGAEVLVIHVIVWGDNDELVMGCNRQEISRMPLIRVSVILDHHALLDQQSHRIATRHVAEATAAAALLHNAGAVIPR